MRLSLQISGSKVQGWDKKPTSSPTSLMITNMFLSMVVLRKISVLAWKRGKIGRGTFLMKFMIFSLY